MPARADRAPGQIRRAAARRRRRRRPGRSHRRGRRARRHCGRRWRRRRAATFSCSKRTTGTGASGEMRSTRADDEMIEHQVADDEDGAAGRAVESWSRAASCRRPIVGAPAAARVRRHREASPARGTASGTRSRRSCIRTCPRRASRRRRRAAPSRATGSGEVFRMPHEIASSVTMNQQPERRAPAARARPRSAAARCAGAS